MDMLISHALIMLVALIHLWIMYLEMVQFVPGLIAFIVFWRVQLS